MTIVRFVLTILTAGLSLCATGETYAADQDLLQAFKKDVQPILRSFCYDCHGSGKKKGDIRFDQLNADLVNGDDAERWHDALDQLNRGEMPPPKAPQPSSKQLQKLTNWLHSALREAAAAKRLKEGRVTTRRLTNYEYANTMRSLLGVELDFARDLPPDPASPEGFRNNGSTLEMSPAQIETYLSAARQALAEVIVTGEQPELFEVSQDSTAVGRLPARKVAGHEPVRPEFILDLPKFPRHGEFELKITARAAIPADQGTPRIRVTMGHVPGIIHVPRGEVGEVDVHGETTTYTFRGRMEDFPQPGPVAFGNSGFKGLIVMVDFLDADGRELRYPDRKYAQAPDKRKKKGKAKGEPTQPKKTTPPAPFGSRLDIEVTAAQFKAPVYASWPPPSHRQLLPEADTEDEAARLRAALKQFLPRAFRRPATDEEIERTVKLFELIRPASESFEDATRETLASVLVSPHFLYLVEMRDEQPGIQPVTDFELASRLSYFLWSAPPDKELRELAELGELRDNEALQRQTLRMLQDDRSENFVRQFVNQWLDLDALDRVAVNPEFFPEFDNRLKREMRRETEAYFTEILQHDLSALDLLQSDWAMVNRRLAQHYGLTGPQSSRFERISLQADNRPGGLLGHGSFLLANSNGEDSHPIKRAVWILDRLLDSPPASPPPEVPELDPDSPDLAKLTLKDQLAAHRKKESCNNCHEGIDPWGVPLENLDAVGRWRTAVPGRKNRPAIAVDAASELPDGSQIDGVASLQQFLLEHRRREFARSVTKRIMAYGLGRSLDFGDREEIDQLTSHFVKDDFRLKSLIVAFVQSDTFQSK